MQILFITSTRLGDAILSTGILNYLSTAYPNGQITVACGKLGQDIFKAFPTVKTVYVLEKQKNHGHWVELWKKTIGTRWDIVVDLRNSAVSRLIFARKRYVYGAWVDKTQHKVVQMAQVLGVTPPPAPKIYIPAALADQAKSLVPDGAPVLMLGPAANWIGKTWLAQNFIELVQKLRTAQFQGWRLGVMAAPNERAQVQPILEAFPDALDLVGAGSPLLMAACLVRAQFFIGNDSGLMHTAAAVGIKTVGLFGPSWPHLYAPWGAHTSYITTPKTFAQLIDYPNYHPDTAPCLMDGLTVDAVYQHISGINLG